MHELILFASIPQTRHDQVLNILAGISAMQPVPILEKHLIFKPNRQPGQTKPAQVGAAQDVQKSLQTQTQGDLYYVQVVGELAENTEFERLSGNGQGGGGELGHDEMVLDESAHPLTRQSDGQDHTEKPGPNWTLHFRDLPEVIRQRPVTSRLMADINISSGNPAKFMAAMDYSLVSSYYLSGHRFTHLNASLLLHRAFLPSATDLEPMSISSDMSKAILLDASGTYVLQASIRVQDGAKVEMMNKGMNELMNLKETLKGAVELDMGDRLAMDTRVR